jgi:DNA-binding NtrC family response regulator
MPRLIVTSSVSLFDRVLQGTFDDRLFHRLNVIHIMVPPGTP